MRLRKKSIALKILLMILTVTFLQAIVLIYFSHGLSEDALKALIKENTTKSVKTYSLLIGNWFEERVKEIEAYAECPEIKKMDWEIAEPYLRNEISRKIDIYDLFLVAELSGEYNTTIKRNPSNISDREYFIEAVKGNKIVSNPIISRTNGNQISVVAVPIKNNNDEIIGVMAGSLNLIKLSKLIENHRVNHENSYSYIIDKNGVIITHPDPTVIMNENITMKSQFVNSDMADKAKEILSSASGSVVYTIDGIECINYYCTIPNTDNWRIITKIPVDYLNTPIKKISSRLSILGLVGVLLGLVLGAFVSKSISLPIIKLKDVFLRAANGDLTVRAEVRSGDEIGDASKIFNEMMNTIRHLTYYDPLTDLPNKIMFNDRVKFEISMAEKEKRMLSLLLLDIDRFESINTAVGHDVGDKLLRGISQKIKENIDSNDILCRMGDDKFCILFTDVIHEANIVKCAQKLMEAIKLPWVIDGHKLYVTASCGIVFYPNDGNDSDTLIKNVYSAMTKAKKTSRDNYQLYDSAAGSKVMDAMLLDSSIHNALENNEFELYFQPMVDIESNKIVGSEALLRWNHPELGMISPDKFIPLIEENGLILPIGEWVLRTACKRNKKWLDHGFESLSVSVNISPKQLKQENFVDTVINILNESALPPDLLQLEITESTTMEDTDQVFKIIKRLKDIGVKIAMDDFGTGYSSLYHLKSLEITAIKIDKSFIRDLNIDPKDTAIVSTIIAIGHNLNLAITAEGVETLDQLNYLRDKKCEHMQGYLYSKPLPAHNFEELLKNPHRLM
ncbi:MAG: bifunctional diguanylate cyclase/phosphodiesterase [Bacillota bacterium]